MSTTVLLIQSDQAKRQRVHEQLEPRGHIVIDSVASSNTHDIAILTRPDLVLFDLDQSAPRPDSALEEISVDTRLANVPVVVADSAQLTELIVQVELNLQMKRLRSEQSGQGHATSDPLTGLYSADHVRHELIHFSAGALRYHHALSIVLVGLDRFDRTNRIHGHEAGDAVLRDVAQRLTSDVRESDLVGRWDADEFILVLPSTPRAGAHFLAERFRQTLAESQHLLPDGTSVSVTASFGCAEIETGVDITEAARSALRTAKRNGRNAVYSS